MEMTLDQMPAIMARAQVGLEAARSDAEPLGLHYFKASASLIGIAAASTAELLAVTLAMSAQFPILSDGQDLGASMRQIGYAIPLYMGFGHIVLRPIADSVGGRIKSVLGGIGVVPVLGMFAGMAVFMFAATAQSAGGEDAQGLFSNLSGPALGLACGSLFGVSFLASNTLAGKFLSSLKAIFGGRVARAAIADIAGEVAAADEYRTRMAALGRDIAEREKPERLRHKAATEAGSIVGMVAAEAHDLHVSRQVRGDAELGPDDQSECPDLPVEVFDRHQQYLKQLTTQYFLDQLQQKEA